MKIEQANIGETVVVKEKSQIYGYKGSTALALHIKMCTAEELFRDISLFTVIDYHERPHYRKRVVIRTALYPIDLFVTDEDNIEEQI